jgi:hypothetical protein
VTVNVSIGANDPTTTIICLYGNRLEGAVFADPNKNLEVVVNRAGTKQVAIHICAYVCFVYLSVCSSTCIHVLF